MARPTYAIIDDHGQQLTVSEGDVVCIDLKDATEKESITFDQVLMVRSDKEVKVGQPTIEGAKVVGTVLGMVKGNKIVVRKFKRRKNYRRKQGHRQRYTQVRIETINA
ncbi:MAG: 50S ribosomal protein L21 [Planctomycetota bacterium]|jgi:large subunit ribosomal protein L21|nr:50S ribosomal protein L21 [Planctomycetota bacterium]